MSLVELFSALGDPTRLRMMEMLHEKSRPVHELAGAFEISRPAISRHLKVLKDAGLVKEDKAGRENVYSLQRGKLKPLQEWLERRRVAEAAAAKRPARSRPGRPGARPAVPVATRRASQVSRAVVQASPPAAAPQLSFFDL